MALHQSDCEICEQVAQCREGTHPRFIAEMDSGYAVLGASQYWPGYSLLLCKEPATELDELVPWFRAQFLADMARLSHAVREAVDPHKLNYSCLGNLVHHLHWHIHPRFLDEPHPELPVWQCMPTPEQEIEYAFNPEAHGEIVAAIRDHLLEIEPL